MEAIVMESKAMFAELKRRRDAHGTSAEEELEKDPKFARKLFVLTGFNQNNCP